MNNHYIYTLTDPNDGVVKYVGQGKNYRYTNWLRAKPSWEFKYGVYPWLWSLKKNDQEPIVTRVLENLSQEQVNAWEFGLIELIGRTWKETGPLLNIADGGKGGSHPQRAETRRKLSEINLGHPVSKEARQKISEAGKGRTPPNKGKKASVETRKKISKAGRGRPAPNKGKKASVETRKKLSAARKNQKTRPCSEETKRKISEAQIGKTVSAITRDRISKSAKGRPSPNKGKMVGEETRKKISLATRGKKRKPHSEETRRKISEAHIGKKRSKEACHNMSLSHKGKKRDPEAVRRTALANTGKKRTEETCRKISESQKGKTRSDAALSKLRHQPPKGKFKGVCPNGRLWAVKIGRHYLGSYSTDETAAKIYNGGVDKYWNGDGWKNRVDHVSAINYPADKERRKSHA